MASTTTTSTFTTTTTTTTTTITPYGPHSTSPNTTFVQADPSTFRTIVQQLTGAPPPNPLNQNPHPMTRTTTATTPGPKKPAFKLHERRKSGKNLQISFNHTDHHFQLRQRGFLVSPVSTLDFFASTRMIMSPRGGDEEEEEVSEEERTAIAEKGFYLRPNPKTGTPRGADPPELLPLFPLRSPRGSEDSNNNDRYSCS